MSWTEKKLLLLLLFPRCSLNENKLLSFTHPYFPYFVFTFPSFCNQWWGVWRYFGLIVGKSEEQMREWKQRILEAGKNIDFENINKFYPSHSLPLAGLQSIKWETDTLENHHGCWNKHAADWYHTYVQEVTNWSKNKYKVSHSGIKLPCATNTALKAPQILFSNSMEH